MVVFHLVAVRNQDIINDDASHFKLTRSVLRIASLNSHTFSILFHFHEFKNC